MTCQSVLEALLDAEPSELVANAATPLGRHLADCAQCRRVASQLMHESGQLAVAMAAMPVRRHSHRRTLQLSFAPALVVAGLVLAVMLRARPDSPTAVRAVEKPVIATPYPAAGSKPVMPETKVARARGTIPLQREARAFAPAVPVTPMRLARAEPADSSVTVAHGVRVTTPPGTRATVMHTSDPKLVVVWLY